MGGGGLGGGGGGLGEGVGGGGLLTTMHKHCNCLTTLATNTTHILRLVLPVLPLSC